MDAVRSVDRWPPNGLAILSWPAGATQQRHVPKRPDRIEGCPKSSPPRNVGFHLHLSGWQRSRRPTSRLRVPLPARIRTRTPTLPPTHTRHSSALHRRETLPPPPPSNPTYHPRTDRLAPHPRTRRPPPPPRLASRPLAPRSPPPRQPTPHPLALRPALHPAPRQMSFTGPHAAGPRPNLAAPLLGAAPPKVDGTIPLQSAYLFRNRSGTGPHQAWMHLASRFVSVPGFGATVVRCLTAAISQLVPLPTELPQTLRGCHKATRHVSS